MGKVSMKGSLATGLALPGKSRFQAVVQIPNYTTAKHETYLETISELLLAAGFGDVRRGPLSVQCYADSVHVKVMIGNKAAWEPFAWNAAASSPFDMERLAASISLYRTRFLQAQPESVKQFLRMVRYWAKTFHDKEWRMAPNTRPTTLMLLLIGLKAFQATSVPGAGSEQHMEAAMHRFLEMVASLSASTLLYMDVYYSKEIVYRALADPDAQAMLRPPGFEEHPIVLDPANPTCNLALGTPDLNLLKAVAQRELQQVPGAMTALQQQQVGLAARLAELQLQQAAAAQQLAQMQLILKRLVTGMQAICRFTCEGQGSMWLVKQPIVLLQPIKAGPFDLQLLTEPAAVVQPDAQSACYAGQMGLRVRFVGNKEDESAAVVLAWMPSISVQIRNLVITAMDTHGDKKTKEWAFFPVVHIPKDSTLEHSACVASLGQDACTALFGTNWAYYSDTGTRENMEATLVKRKILLKGELVVGV
eukprot:CAMPEP_0202898532 /NCGR_PEP_ID=MMETSP1392-20130828/7028_1 /ASSEMBLY_ACC=CAM_ASM_000868 /TAXON_ID=225041 /ORGANISM="Chlamydomonas chlamydogama, Strain SAG 11-48b" /LENGTH=476 /DNA_ID=CAMNT_0049584489 /DNA_START=315 /DNA_END=1745 /DNA_ORIENTATION=-